MEGLKPDPYAAANMADIDAMPKRWRDLVREFGYVPVNAKMEQGVSYDDALEQLEMQRAVKQDEYRTQQFVGRKRG